MPTSYIELSQSALEKNFKFFEWLNFEIKMKIFNFCKWLVNLFYEMGFEKSKLENKEKRFKQFFIYFILKFKTEDFSELEFNY